MQNARLDETQGGMKTARRNINNLKYRDDNTLMAESKDELMSLLMKVKEKKRENKQTNKNKKVKEAREKVGLKLNIQKMKIRTTSPITL